MIDKDKVIRGLELLAHWPDGLIITDKEKWIKPCCEMAIALLKEQDSCENCAIAIEDRQPVVRCKDCKYWRQLYGDKPFYSHIGCCDCDDVSRKIHDCGCYPDFRTDSDWFCADGERR